MPAIDSAMPSTPRALTRSTPRTRPMIAMNAGDAAMTSAASLARVRAMPSTKKN